MVKIPTDWDFLKLSDICSFENGDRGKNYPSQKDYVSQGIPFINAGDLVNFSISKEGLNYISKEKYHSLGSGKFAKDDILFCLRGSLGKFAVVEEDIEGAIASSLVIIRANEKVLNKFLSLYFQSSLCYSNIKLYDNGSAQPNLSAGNLRKFEIPLPPIPEQIRIVKKLDALFIRIDRSISLLEENINYNQALKNSIIENNFIKLFNHSKTFKIKEIAEIKGGKRLPKGETVLDEKTDYPYIRVTDFNDNGSIDLNNLKYLKKEVQEQIKRYIITLKDLYISIAGTIGKTGIIPKELDNANLTENAARLVFKSNLKINNRFIYYFTLSNNFKEQVGMATKTVAQPKLALTRLAEVEIPIPSIEMQDKEVKEFDLISFKTNEILKYQQSKLTYLKALKASILDKAFKGEL